MTDIQILYDGPIVKRQDAKAAGHTHYFTGKPCPHGHVDLRFVSSYACRACADAHKKRYRQNDDFRNKELEYKKRYYQEHRAEYSEYRKWYWRNHPNAKLADKAAKIKRRQAISEYNRIYSIDNRDAIYARRAERYAENPEIFLQYSRNRRAALMDADGTHTAEDVDVIYNRQGGRCAEPTCGVDLIDTGYHVDHIMPLKLGGSNWPSNLQCLCPSCNSKKNAMHPIDWARKNGRLC